MIIRFEVIDEEGYSTTIVVEADTEQEAYALLPHGVYDAVLISKKPA